MRGQDVDPEETAGLAGSLLARRGRLRVVVIKGVIIPEQLTLWQACKDMGADITIIGTDANVYEGIWPWQPRSPEELRAVLLDPMAPSMARGHLWWAYRGLSRTLRSLRPDIIHVTSEPWGALVMQALLVRRLAGLPVPVSIHAAENIYAQGSRAERIIRALIIRAVMPRLDGVASWSKEVVDLAHRTGLRSVPTTVVPELVPDPTQFQPIGPTRRQALRHGFGLPLEEPVVGYVGRLHEEKGIPDLLSAFKRLGASAPFLSVWGAGPLKGLVERTLDGGDIRGRFGGALRVHDVAGALQACDLVVVPSRTTATFKEQFGRVILEAMQAGCPVVAFRSGAIPEVVGDSGVLVEEGDVDGLAAAIRRLAADPLARQELVEKGRQEALRRFHPNMLAQRMLHFWSEVLAQ
jgi:glycosyltransferase involved in cell wall biosynthesis